MRRLRTPLRLCLAALWNLGAGVALPAQTDPGLATASPPATLTLADAVDRALGRYPAMAAARARAAEAAATTAEAEVSRGPIVKLNAVGLQYDDPMITSPIHSFVPADFPPFAETIVQGSLSVSYILVDSGASRERSRQAEAAARAASARRVSTSAALPAAKSWRARSSSRPRAAMRASSAARISARASAPA